MSNEKGRRLGRGLDALIPASRTVEVDLSGGALRQIPVAQIRPNPYQPRREFDAEELAELEASIRTSGLLQPIAVRPVGDEYELIAGERRLRAVARLGWPTVSAVVKEVDERTLLTLAMIENLQRSDLNPIEEAAGYRRLIDEFGMTQQQVADAIGKDRTTVTGLLRILNLPSNVVSLVESGKLSAGHARALLGCSNDRDIISICNETVLRHLSVREVERRVRASTGAPPISAKTRTPHGAPTSTTVPASLREIEDRLRRRLQTDTRLRLTGPDKGTIEIGFYSADDLERLLDLMLGVRQDL
jgi:ParB family chromosome partitioning protein